MGGKKKTKWRKVPLEEFTKEISSTPEKVPLNDACQTDVTREANNYIPPYKPYNESSENAHNYTESYEYIDDLWYPTSCVVYNPAEVGMYSNYMMPVDTCYYYTMPEVPQVQEYVPMSYQEYTSTSPKDIVYLLIPAQALRTSQPVQNLAPAWHTRRRRRYEGYAEYAVIPDRPNSTKSAEAGSNCVTGQVPNSRRNSAQSSNLKKMTSEASALYDCDSKQNPGFSNDMKKTFELPSDMNSSKSPMSVNEEMRCLSEESTENNQKPKKNFEMCGIHANSTMKNDPQTLKETNSKLSLKNENFDVKEEDKENKKTPIELASESGKQEKSDETNDMSKFSRSFLDALLRNSIPITTATKPNESIATGIHNEIQKDIPQKSSMDKSQHNEREEESEDSSETPLTDEMKALHSFHSPSADENVYKFAYQSEKDSKSPSPTDRRAQMPHSHFFDEIYVLETGSDNEDWTDVSNPQMYVTETPECKHIFINRMSLAAELLLTNEPLPYDAEFKRIVDDDDDDDADDESEAEPAEQKVKHVFVDYSQNPFKPSFVCGNNNEPFELDELRCETRVEDNTEARPSCGRIIANATGNLLPRVFRLDPRPFCTIM